MTMRPVLAVLGMMLTVSLAEAADLPGPFVIDEPIEADAPCADPRVLERIAERFAWAERNTWHRGFVIASIGNGRVNQHAFYEPGIIRREYCAADTMMTNGSNHIVYYAIEFGAGFASIGNYVDFCVPGLDPWHVHDEACRTVR